MNVSYVAWILFNTLKTYEIRNLPWRRDILPSQISLGYNRQDQYDNRCLPHKNGKAYLRWPILGS
jgi:hypothetical protein